MPSRNWIPLPDDTFLIDTGYLRPQMTASYLLRDGRHAAFIETGTARSVERLLQCLSDLEMSVNDVEWVLVTHVHLDHAGGAGTLLRELPNARLVVHPRGARHMIDPRKLAASAEAVYGPERFKKLYGSLPAVAKERVVEATDGLEISLNQRVLRLLDTPGHAKHHVCIHDTRSNGIFTGDVFGLAYPELATPDGPFVFPTTSPTQFDPDAMKQSLQRLVAADPACLFLTHFGVIENVGPAAAAVATLLDDLVELAGSIPAPQIRPAIMELLLSRLAAARCPRAPVECQPYLELDVELNAQGLRHWLGQPSPPPAGRHP